VNPRVLKFFSYYLPYKRLFIADMLCALVAVMTALALPVIARHITQVVLAQPGPEELSLVFALGMVMLGLVGLQAVCGWVVDYHGHRMGALMERDLRAELFAHYQKLSFRFYDDQQTGQLMSRLGTDSLTVSELFHHGPEDSVIALLKFVGAFVILSAINLPLTALVFVFLPVVGAYAYVFFRRMVAATRRSYERIGDINAQVEDTLAGIRVVQSFANETHEAHKFAHRNERFVESRREGYLSEAFFSAGLTASTQVVSIAVILFGGAAIASGTLSAPDLVVFLLFVAILTDPIQRAINIVRLLQEGVTGFNRIADMLDIAPDIQDAPDAVDAPPVTGRIDFVGVSFQYHPQQPPVLSGVSLSIGAGEYVALVGTSGVGKTTLCSLIPRFYEPTAGAVLLDGQDVRGIRLQSLRRSIGIVQQDVYLFAGTVADNIRYGRLEATHDEVVAAARQAHAHDFIMALPNGYHTNIGQRGVRLSGGQKQRLSIARVFLKDVRIIIFDEATSALDSESERAVQRSIEALSQQRTMIVIAHRLSTIRNARRIIVLDDAGVAQQGTHDELLAAGGPYALLYGLQQQARL
jgi:ATP-binding cassette subfamily B protein